jgi:glycosyltransferase involved in cell wall biosynthesis
MSNSKLKSAIFRECISAIEQGDRMAAIDAIASLELSPDDIAASRLASHLQRLIAGSVESLAAKDFPAEDTAADLVTFVIVTPCLNSERFIDDTIASVFQQRGRFRLLYHVQDGGSTDGTHNILHKWTVHARTRKADRLPSIDFSWSSAADSGMYEAIQRGFNQLVDRAGESSATIVMSWLNSDDLLASQSLCSVASFFNEHPEIHWIIGIGSTLDADGVVTATWPLGDGYPQNLVAAGYFDGRTLPFIQQEGCFWTRDLWRRCGGLNWAQFRLAGDWDLWRRMALHTPLVTLDAVLGYHRRHESQLSKDVVSYTREMDTASSLQHLTQALPDMGLTAIYSPERLSMNIICRNPQAYSSQNRKLEEQRLSLSSDREGEQLRVPATAPSGRPWPKISVVTPTFNQGQFIAETIDSVLGQNYPNLEFIIIDGLSTDNTPDIVASYGDRITRVVREADKGQSDALNKGFALATGEILCWLNSDDQFADRALFAVAIAFDTHAVDIVSGICEVYSDGQLVHRHMSACKDGPLPMDDLLDLDRGWNAGQFFYQPEVFFTRDIWVRAGAHVRVDCHYSMDYELWCRFADAGAKLKVIGAPLAKFRMHPEQKTADPSKFKSELVQVSQRFADDRGLTIRPSRRPDFSHSGKLKVAMVNDHGPNYGAGIAHGRLAAIMQVAGHDVRLHALTNFLDRDGAVQSASLLAVLARDAPDIVVIGNVHSVGAGAVHVVDEISRHFRTYCVVHDFWILTGRCAYPRDCTKFNTGCDHTCPTPTEYPSLEPHLIATAWQSKQDLLRSDHAPVLITNSTWTDDFVRGALESGGGRTSRTARLKLGAPEHLFRRMPQRLARRKLEVPPDSFAIAFSVSSLSDERKGGQILLAALRALDLRDVTLVLIGHQDRPITIPGLNVIALGYVTDPNLLCTALSAADVYVGPSTEETFGQVFIEAALTGTPSIGFDYSGVRDAIRDGVTGIRAPCTQEALGAAIASLYHNRDHTKDLSFWAAIYGKNEFSLESSYHSLFGLFDADGLVDRMALPHKIGFDHKTDLMPAMATAAGVQMLEGISPLEGPYPPRFPKPIMWCHGRRIRLRAGSGKPGAGTYRFVVQQPLFEALDVDVWADGVWAQRVRLGRLEAADTHTVVVDCSSPSGMVDFRFVPSELHSPAGGERRALAFMLLSVKFDAA